MMIQSLAKKIFPLVAGAGLGFTYWYFIGCSTGTCPITSSWYTSTAYGVIVGATFLLNPKPLRSKQGPVSRTDIKTQNHLKGS